ncbi:MAG: hypothetical protein HY553_08635 [Elusimicrobia bacterium]|nr:hypothetical protein [Elusimicrobiota bacterium]
MPTAALLLAALAGAPSAASGYSVEGSSTSKKLVEDLQSAADRGDRASLGALFDGGDRSAVATEGAPTTKQMATLERPAARQSGNADASPKAKNSTLHAIEQTPRYAKEAFSDPLRRRNIASRVTEGLIGAAAAVAGYALLGPIGLFAGVAAEFLFYEYIAEPQGWSGHYWERGPRDGESFKHDPKPGTRS